MNRPTLSLLAIAFLHTVLSAQLSGTYTVGGNAPDHADPAAAVQALLTEGASGDVSFLIRPGTYVGQYTLGAIPGSPGRITFTSESGEAGSVSLEFSATDDEANHIFLIDGASNITLRDLTLRALDATRASLVRLRNGSNEFELTNCILEGSFSKTSSLPTRRQLFWCDQQSVGDFPNPEQIRIIGNTFRGGTTGVVLDALGLLGSRSEGLLIADNTFEEQRNGGIRVFNCRGTISGNRMVTARGVGYTGITANRLEGPGHVLGNTVEATCTSGCFGLVIGNTLGTTDNLIANNRVYLHSDADMDGIRTVNLAGMRIAHNSILVTGTGNPLSWAFRDPGNFPDEQTTELVNNIFSNEAGGPAIQVNVAGNIAVEHFNVLHTTGDTVTKVGNTAYTSLSAYQAASGLGQNSLATDPVFPLRPDLRLNDCTLNDQGTPVVGLETDALGVLRDPATPDMGALEYEPAFVLELPELVLAAADLPFVLELPTTFSDHQWNTGATTPSIEISAGGLYSCAVEDVNGCTYTLLRFVTIDLTTTVAVEERPNMLIHPVPTTGLLWAVDMPADVPYRIHDASGRIVGTGLWPRNQPMDMSFLGRGLFLLEFHIGKERTTARFIVE